jgi:hypothetical protein
MVLDRFIDVAKVAPKYFSVEIENADVRVLRAKLWRGADSAPRRPLGRNRCLDRCALRLTTPDGKSRDIHVKAGETHWIDGDTFSEQNLSSTACEFLLVETLRPKAPVSDAPPA